MKKSQILDYIAKNLFGEPQTFKSYEAMINYLNQLEMDQLKMMLKTKISDHMN